MSWNYLLHRILRESIMEMFILKSDSSNERKHTHTRIFYFDVVNILIVLISTSKKTKRGNQQVV